MISVAVPEGAEGEDAVHGSTGRSSLTRASNA